MRETLTTIYNHRLLSGIMLALGGTVLFSLKPVMVKLAYLESIDSLTLLTLRMLFALPVYLFFAWKVIPERMNQSQLSVKTIAGIIFLGFAGYYLAAYLDLLGLQYISAQLERITLFTYPTMVVLLGYVFFRERLNRNAILALALTYVGIVLIYYRERLFLGNQTATGMLFVALAALSFALYVVFSANFIKQLGSRLFTSLAMLASSFFIFIHFLVVGDVSDLILDTRSYLLVLVLAIPCTVIPSFMISEAISRIGPSKTSIVSAAGPAITIVFAVILLGEPFALSYIAGMLLVVGGISLLRKK